MEIYLVGGAVRDEMLGRPVHERDWVVVGATPEEMHANGFTRKDPAFPVFVHPDTGDEYALARKETKRGDGHRGFELECTPTISLEEDLARRDLTVNAMARSVLGKLIDPFRGVEDLEQRCLRRVTTAFEEDPLRVLRLARFLAELNEFGFRIDPGTNAMAARMCRSEDFTTLSGTRVWQESRRALLSNHPEVYFEALARWDAARLLMPELTKERGVFDGKALFRLSSLVEGADPAVPRLALLFAAANTAGVDDPEQVERAALSLSKRFALPRDVRELLVTACRPLPDHPLDGRQVLVWIENVDGLRHTDRVRVALSVRSHLGDLSPPTRSRLLEAIEHVRAIRPAPDSIPSRETVRAARVAALEELLGNQQ